ncbi:MAG: hypothetical protein IK015_04670 [Treponema sp.]|nr:hypothetical protein [Treponema sp.]
MDIVQDDWIDEEEARRWLNAGYEGIDLLPNVPQTLTPLAAASVLDVSMPTVERMLKAGEIGLTKAGVLEYLEKNVLVNQPLQWEDEMKIEARQLEGKELAEHEKAFSDMDDNLFDSPDQPSLFDQEDLERQKDEVA